MEMEQMMVRLLAEMKTNQAKTNVNLMEIREEMRASQELQKEETVGKVDGHHERMMARMDSQL
jgi:hypothetical protein